MEIKGKVVYTPELFKKINRFNLFRSKILIAALILFELLAILIFLVSIALGKFSTAPETFILILCLAIAYPLLLFFLPAISAKYIQNLSGIETYFIFYDDSVTVLSRSPKMNSDSNISYIAFHRVYETSDCFYLYLTRLQTYPLLKKDVEYGRSEELSALLMSRVPMGKYIIK